MARAARGVLPSESVVLISISSRKMSRASRRSASDRPDWVAPTRGSRASVSAAHATRATKRITSRMASIYRIGPEAERSEEHTSELQSPYDLVCRLLLEKKKKKRMNVHDKICYSYS